VAPLNHLWRNGVMSEASLIEHGARTADTGTYKLHFALSSGDLE